MPASPFGSAFRVTFVVPVFTTGEVGTAALLTASVTFGSRGVLSRSRLSVWSMHTFVHFFPVFRAG